MCTVMTIVFALADASLLFGSALSNHLAVAVSMTMISAVVLTLVVGLLSTFRGVVAGAQEASIVVLATMTASIHSSMQAVDGQNESAILATVVASVVIATVSFGFACLVLGTLRLGRFIRYIPFPVITGFLAGAGLLMIKFGLELALGFNPFANLTIDTLSVGMLAKLTATVLMVFLLFWMSGENKSRYAIPILVVLAVLVFLLVVFLSGSGMATWVDSDWMLIRDAQATVYPPIQFSDFSLIDWSVVAAQVPQMGILVIVCVTGALVKINALEVILRTDVDQEKELRALGGANIIAGFLGGYCGFHTLGLTQIVKRMHAEYRLIGVLVSLFTLIAFVFSADLLFYMPRFVFAAIIIWVGVDMVINFLLQPMETLKKLEMAIVVLVVLLILFFGFIPAMIFGIIAGMFLFIIDFSRIDVIRRQYTGRHIQSNVDRTGEIRDILYKHGNELRVFCIHGFLFFGTSYRLVQQVRNNLETVRAKQVRFLILDFEKVVRIDSSARVTLSRLVAFADARNLTFLVSGAKGDVQVALQIAFCAEDGYRSPQFFDSLDHALEWYEHWQLNDLRVGAEHGRRIGLHEWVGFDFDKQLMNQMFQYVSSRTLAAGETLFRKGELTDGMYLVQYGSLDIFVATDEETIRVRKVGPGAVLGEVSLYLNQPATASVVATTDAEVLHFTRQQLTQMLLENPAIAAHFHERMARVMAYRMADNNRLIKARTDS